MASRKKISLLRSIFCAHSAVLELVIEVFESHHFVFARKARVHHFRSSDADVAIIGPVEHEHRCLDPLCVLCRRPLEDVRAITDDGFHKVEVGPIARFFLDAVKIGDRRDGDNRLEEVRLDDRGRALKT
jgi:hypothetical protein